MDSTNDAAVEQCAMSSAGQQVLATYATCDWWFRLVKTAPFVTAASFIPVLANVFDYFGADVAYPLWAALLVTGVGMSAIGSWRTRVWHKRAHDMLDKLPPREAVTILEERIAKRFR